MSGVDVREHRRPNEVARRWDGALDRGSRPGSGPGLPAGSRSDESGALGLRCADRRADVLDTASARRPGPCRSFRAGRRRPSSSRSARRASVEERPSDRPMQQDAARGRAPLAGVRKAGGDRGIDRLRRDPRRPSRSARSCRRARAACASGSRRPAAECVLPTSVEPVNEIARTRGSWHEGVADRRSSARDAVEHTRRETRLLEQRRHEDAGPGRERRRLEHDGVARQQRRQRLPAHHVHREVPRADDAGDAERLVLHPGRMSREAPGPACRVERRDLIQVMAALDERRIDFRARLADRLAVFERDDPRELFARVLEQPEKCRDVLLAFGDWRAPP